MSHTDIYLDVKGLAARYPGVTPATVYAWLYKGTAPQSIKLGKRRLFKLADVVAWEHQHAERGGGTMPQREQRTSSNGACLRTPNGRGRRLRT
jgi:predicted DNA-binding transcriptional regulator AlpA